MGSITDGEEVCHPQARGACRRMGPEGEEETLFVSGTLSSDSTIASASRRATLDLEFDFATPSAAADILRAATTSHWVQRAASSPAGSIEEGPAPICGVDPNGIPVLLEKETVKWGEPVGCVPARHASAVGPAKAPALPCDGRSTDDALLLGLETRPPAGWPGRGGLRASLSLDSADAAHALAQGSSQRRHRRLWQSSLDEDGSAVSVPADVMEGGVRGGWDEDARSSYNRLIAAICVPAPLSGPVL
mmetsp:Transcript_38951/g.90865  ORF Transcript_38951/g.90865 Transcript_38951/m.90865 type:complete len:247 (-) Transcript_38951:236-976(-)